MRREVDQHPHLRRIAYARDLLRDIRMRTFGDREEVHPAFDQLGKLLEEIQRVAARKAHLVRKLRAAARKQRRRHCRMVDKHRPKNWRPVFADGAPCGPIPTPPLLIGEVEAGPECVVCGPMGSTGHDEGKHANELAVNPPRPGDLALSWPIPAPVPLVITPLLNIDISTLGLEPPPLPAIRWEDSQGHLPIADQPPVAPEVARPSRDPELAHCHAGRDGDCYWEKCPQLRDGEPQKSHRPCPLDRGVDDEA